MRQLLVILFVGLFGLTNANNPSFFVSKSKTPDTGVMKKAFKTQSYDYIIVHGNFKVNLVKGAEGRIQTFANKKLLDLLSIKSDGRVLEVKMKDGASDALGLFDSRKVSITIPFKNLKGLTVLGATDISTDDKIAGNRFYLRASGSSKLNLKLAVEKFQCNIFQSSKVKILGFAKEAVLYTKNSGEVDAYGLHSDLMTVKSYDESSVNMDVNKYITHKVYELNPSEKGKN